MDMPVETTTFRDLAGADHAEDDLRRLVDRQEVADLLTRLGRLLDEGRHRDAHSVYTRDVAVRSPRGGTLRGLDEVISYLEASRVEGERTQHVYTDVLVDLDGDRAEVSANTFTYFYRDGEPPHQTGGLRIQGIAVRTPEGWRLRSIEMTLAWIDQTTPASGG